MRIFNAKHNLLIIFLCTLLTIQPITPMPPQEVHFEPSPSYAIACFVSFCLGTILCALINKYCVQQPVIPSVEKISSEPTDAASKKKSLLNQSIPPYK